MRRGVCAGVNDCFRASWRGVVAGRRGRRDRRRHCVTQSDAVFRERPPPASGATRNLAGSLCCVNTTGDQRKSAPLVAVLSLKTLPLLNCFTFVNDYFVFSNRFV
ncbi:protein of unknown function [Burkholderia multivorans]